MLATWFEMIAWLNGLSERCTPSFSGGANGGCTTGIATLFGRSS